MIHIIFPHVWPDRSPSLKGLIGALNRRHIQYTLYLPPKIANVGITFERVKFLRENYLTGYIVRFLLAIFRRSNWFEEVLKYLIVQLLLRQKLPYGCCDARHTIVFDFYGLREIVKLNRAATVYSTEIYSYLESVGMLHPFERTKIVSQSLSRSNYVGYNHRRTFIVPNSYAPDCEGHAVKKHSLLYSGTFSRPLGSEILINLFGVSSGISQEITIHAANVGCEFYGCDGVNIIRDFLSDDELTYLISCHEVGLVFYDANYVDKLQVFNFETAPSGKMYRYASCGVPIIGSRCAGLIDVELHSAGILLDEINVLTLQAAYRQIKSNYAKYVSGCRQLMMASDFNNSIDRFLDSLEISN
jgi:hypothetical protein